MTEAENTSKGVGTPFLEVIKYTNHDSPITQQIDVLLRFGPHGCSSSRVTPILLVES